LPDERPPLGLAEAVAIGLVHGPAERAPVSSSAHTTLVPWLLRWRYGELDAPARKRFEVALHAGATAAVLLASRRRSGVPARVVVLACLPPAVAGALLEGPIERRLGTPATIAGGLAAGGLLMAAAERRRGDARDAADAGALDALAIGVAQAAALVPGVSRSGAARAAARWRGFAPAQARALSDAVGLPITIGAIALKGRQALDGGRAERAALAAGAAAAFASTIAADAALRRGRSGGASLYPYAAYRVALAALVIRRLRQNPQR
jgi:undecaprenyl-diphosphatase